MSSGPKEAWENPCNTEFLPAMKSVYVSDVEKLLGKKYGSRAELEANMADDFRNYAREQQSEISALKAKVEWLRKDEERLRGLRELCGFVQDGSHVTLHIGQDDATYEWSVRVDKKEVGSGASFIEAINAAIKEPK